MKDPNCLFCKIIDRKIPSTAVFENETVYAFKDIHPKAPVHYLFVPKDHHESLAHVPRAKLSVLTEIFSAIQEVTEKEGVAKTGYKTVIHTGKGGGQEVFHLHVHLMAGH